MEKDEPDLFVAAKEPPSRPTQPICSIDGHRIESVAEAQICQWLYLSGITHAIRRRLPIETELYADFYLPDAQIYIEYWGHEEGSGQLAGKLTRQRIYNENHFKVIDLQQDDLSHLDEVLLRELLRAGLAVD